MTSVLFLSESGSKELIGLPVVAVMNSLTTVVGEEGREAVGRVGEAAPVDVAGMTLLTLHRFPTNITENHH